MSFNSQLKTLMACNVLLVLSMIGMTVALGTQQSSWEHRYQALQQREADLVVDGARRERETLEQLTADHARELAELQARYEGDLQARDAQVHTLACQLRQTRVLVASLQQGPPSVF